MKIDLLEIKLICASAIFLIALVGGLLPHRMKNAQNGMRYLGIFIHFLFFFNFYS